MAEICWIYFCEYALFSKLAPNWSVIHNLIYGDLICVIFLEMLQEVSTTLALGQFNVFAYIQLYNNIIAFHRLTFLMSLSAKSHAQGQFAQYTNVFFTLPKSPWKHCYSLFRSFIKLNTECFPLPQGHFFPWFSHQHRNLHMTSLTKL